LLERLKPWSVTLYCTDDYAPYDTLLPVGRHYIGKDETVAIERVNSRLRHWFARFRRRTCVVSKAREMVDATSLPPTTLMEQRQNSPCHCLLNTLFQTATDVTVHPRSMGLAALSKRAVRRSARWLRRK
jgi:insertion element IS1 protein InsB